MVGLRKVSICNVNLSKTFLDAFLGIAANKPLQISLDWNIYPYGVIPTPHAPLQISHLRPRFARILSIDVTYVWKGLSVPGDGDELMKLADINLPFLHDLTLFISPGSEASRRGAAAFLTAQKAIRKLDLSGTGSPLPPIPPNALPNLRALKASPELVNQLVPGRPVEAIEVTFYQCGYNPDWFGEEVTQSTARVRMLRVHLDTAILDTRMVKRMVTIPPFLESLWLPVRVDVSWPFRAITRTLAAHFPSDTPHRRSPHFT